MSGVPEEIIRERDEIAAWWCIRLAGDPLDPADMQDFNAWIAVDPANAKAFGEAVTIWEGIDRLTDVPEMIGFRAEAVEGLRRANASRWSPVAVRRWRWPAAIAACLAIVLLAGAWLLHDPTRRYETGIGERRMVMLDDGTRITLDASSRVDVRLDPDRRRLELVAGRAKFDVAHDPLRPLSVLARNRLTIATGTSFSVELLPRQMRVVLYEGKVEVMAQGADGARRTIRLVDTAAERGALVPGRELIASTEGSETRIAEADMTRSLSWESGMLSFDGEPLAIAVERINRDAKIKLVVGDPGVAAYAISGVFTAGDVEAFVEGVSALYPVEVTREPGRLVLKRLRKEEKIQQPSV